MRDWVYWGVGHLVTERCDKLTDHRTTINNHQVCLFNVFRLYSEVQFQRGIVHFTDAVTMQYC